MYWFVMNVCVCESPPANPPDDQFEKSKQVLTGISFRQTDRQTENRETGSRSEGEWEEREREREKETLKKAREDWRLSPYFS